MPQNVRMATFKVKSKGTKLDFTATAANIVSQAIGSDLFTQEPLPNPNEGKDLAATERSEIAKKAAKSRWNKP